MQLVKRLGPCSVVSHSIFLLTFQNYQLDIFLTVEIIMFAFFFLFLSSSFHIPYPECQRLFFGGFRSNSGISLNYHHEVPGVVVWPLLLK